MRNTFVAGGAQREYNAEYLLLKAQRTVTAEDENAWPSLSLALAMRGMEDEDTPEYTVADLKERFTPMGGALSSPARSTIERFRGEYEDHIANGRCAKGV